MVMTWLVLLKPTKWHVAGFKAMQQAIISQPALNKTANGSYHQTAARRGIWLTGYVPSENRCAQNLQNLRIP
jgi:hypothetical protein